MDAESVYCGREEENIDPKFNLLAHTQTHEIYENM